MHWRVTQPLGTPPAQRENGISYCRAVETNWFFSTKLKLDSCNTHASLQSVVQSNLSHILSSKSIPRDWRTGFGTLRTGLQIWVSLWRKSGLNSWDCSKDFSCGVHAWPLLIYFSENVKTVCTRILPPRPWPKAGTMLYYYLVLSSSCNSYCIVMLSKHVNRLGNPLLLQLWSSGEGKRNSFFHWASPVYWVPVLVLYHLTLKRHCWINGTSIFTERKTQTLK